MESNRCYLFAGTYSYGHVISINKIHTTGPDTLEDLHLEAINRNINVSYPFNMICNSIQNELPSLEWQKQNIWDMSDRNLVTKEELELINNYGNYSFSEMNEDLRRYPNQDALMNRTISKMLPIDKDIVVFRYIDTFKFLPLEIGQTFESYGYLSTSISAGLITEGACESNEGAVMRIHVSRGTKCIYLPGRERELIFSHGISLQLINVTYNKFYCLKNGKFSTDNDIILYDFVMA